jgi:hypothetical protein
LRVCAQHVPHQFDQARAGTTIGRGDLSTLEQFSRAIGDETRSYTLHYVDGPRQLSSEQRSRLGGSRLGVDELLFAV